MNDRYVGKNHSEIFTSPQGWVEVRWGKLIDQAEYFDIAQRMLDLITAMEDEKGYSLMLIDFSRLEEITQEAAAFATLATRDFGCRKIAGFGIKPQFKGILDLIKERSTKAETIQEFSDREAAEKWLLEL